MIQQITVRDGDREVPVFVTIDENGVGVTIEGADPDKPLVDVFVEILDNKVTAHFEDAETGIACVHTLVGDLDSAMAAEPAQVG